MSRNPRHRATPTTAEDLKLPAWVDRLDARIDAWRERVEAALERFARRIEAWADRLEAE